MMQLPEKSFEAKKLLITFSLYCCISSSNTARTWWAADHHETSRSTIWIQNALWNVPPQSSCAGPKFLMFSKIEKRGKWIRYFKLLKIFENPVIMSYNVLEVRKLYFRNCALIQNTLPLCQFSIRGSDFWDGKEYEVFPTDTPRIADLGAHSADSKAAKIDETSKLVKKIWKQSKVSVSEFPSMQPLWIKDLYCQLVSECRKIRHMKRNL